MQSKPTSVVEYAIVLLIVVSLFEMGFFYSTRKEAELYRSGSNFPLPSGYLSDGKFMPRVEAPCTLMRLSSDGCPYCKIDQPRYHELLERGRQAGCVSILLAAKTGQVNFKGDDFGTNYLNFIDVDLARALNPLSTPQTILLNREGRVIWSRVGTMDGRSLSNAIEALGETH